MARIREPKAVGPADRGAVRVFLCGDVMLGRGIDQALPHPSDPELREHYVQSARTYLELAEQANGPIPRPMPYADLWGAAQETWRNLAPDLRLMNLETAVTASDDFAPKAINYRMNPDNMPALKASGVDACALANNHVLDFGEDGLLDTLAALRGHDIATAGAGADAAQARAPAVLSAQGTRVLFYSVACVDSGVPPDWAAGHHRPGVALVAPTREGAHELAARVKDARRPGDLAIVSIHWGSNWGYPPSAAHRDFAHALIDSGEVALVHGHSSHHPRPMEVHRERLILYGCGDFLNDYEGIRGYEAYRSQLVAMYFADLEAATGRLIRLTLAPLEVRRFRLNAADPSLVAWLAETLTRESRRFGVRLEVASPGLVAAAWPRADAPAGPGP